MLPRIQSIILDYDEAEGVWRDGEGDLLCKDALLQAALNQLGRSGFTVCASGGVSGSGFGPTRLFLMRPIFEDPSPDAEKPRKRWLGDEGEEGTGSPLDGA
jgi:hypothetical protein